MRPNGKRFFGQAWISKGLIIGDVEGTASQLFSLAEQLDPELGRQGRFRYGVNRGDVYPDFSKDAAFPPGVDDPRKVYRAKVLAISPHGPVGRYMEVKDVWKTVEAQGGQWEKDHARHPLVLRALGERYGG